MKLLKSGFEMILALIFLLYVIFVGTLSVLLNISQRHDESVTLLNKIRDLLKQNNNVDRTVSLNEDLEIPAFIRRE
jgi:mannitol/fructose-specific phosphotransferase system IIA component|tara:strand:- start:197 stop:424 length:228 start_codon:yes stop_codon:yes gene_type:complete